MQLIVISTQSYSDPQTASVDIPPAITKLFGNDPKKILAELKGLDKGTNPTACYKLVFASYKTCEADFENAVKQSKDMGDDINSPCKKIAEAMASNLCASQSYAKIFKLFYGRSATQPVKSR